MANNYIMDYGQDGLEETMNACGEAGLLTCGAGKDLQTAQEPLFVIRKETKIAIVLWLRESLVLQKKRSPAQLR